MSLRMNRRRQSSFKERRHSFGNAGPRRSSLTYKDTELIRSMFQKKPRLSDGQILFCLTAAPLLIFSHQYLICGQFLVPSRESALAYQQWSSAEGIILIFCNWKAWLVVIFHVQLQLLFLFILPTGDQWETGGVHNNSTPPTPTRDNNFEAFLLACLLYVFAVTVRLLDGDLIFLNWMGIMFATSLLYVGTQLLLLIATPTMTYRSRLDSSTATGGFDRKAEEGEDPCSDGILQTIFYGSQPRPIIFGVDVKAFLTHRFSITLWALYTLSACFHAKQTCGRINARLALCGFLQLVYMARRQYFCTPTVASPVDAAGCYRLWGVMVFLPTVYSTPVTLLAQKCATTNPSIISSITIVTAGLIAQYMNTAVDMQKHRFRQANGQIKLRGSTDPFFINAVYRKENGEPSIGLLLGSGYWGAARHLNYAFEMLSFLSWSLALGWSLPYGYMPAMLLAGLVYVRIVKDELRCMHKYGHYWQQHCSRVPHRLIPGIL